MVEVEKKKKQVDPFHEPHTNWSLFVVITVLILLLIVVGGIMFGIAECMVRRGKKMEIQEVESMVAMDASSETSSENHEVL